MTPLILQPQQTLSSCGLSEVEHSGENEHGDHDSYTDVTLRRAITEGFDPENVRLGPAMPRWRMSAQDLTDLIGFLQGADAE